MLRHPFDSYIFPLSVDFGSYLPLCSNPHTCKPEAEGCIIWVWGRCILLNIIGDPLQKGNLRLGVDKIFC